MTQRDEAERLADLIVRIPSNAHDWNTLMDTAKLLRSMAAEIERLKVAYRTELDTVSIRNYELRMKIQEQAVEIDHQKKCAQDWFDRSQRKDALLKQSASALKWVISYIDSMPEGALMEAKQWAVIGKKVRANIKTELGGNHG